MKAAIAAASSSDRRTTLALGKSFDFILGGEDEALGPSPMIQPAGPSPRSAMPRVAERGPMSDV